MDRPQWLFRDAMPAYTYRWRPKAWKVSLLYHTLDVEDEDADNFFKVIGQPLEEPTFRELVSAAEYRRQHSVERANARRIAAIAAEVQEYLKIKQWRIRLRHAAADLDWELAPYSKHIEAHKKEQERKQREQENALPEPLKQQRYIQRLNAQRAAAQAGWETRRRMAHAAASEPDKQQIRLAADQALEEAKAAKAAELAAERAAADAEKWRKELDDMMRLNQISEVFAGNQTERAKTEISRRIMLAMQDTYPRIVSIDELRVKTWCGDRNFLIGCLKELIAQGKLIPKSLAA